MAEPTNEVLFICYSHTDSTYRERFSSYLQAPQILARWRVFSDANIEPGEQWAEKIESCLQEATAALVLVSQDFMISPFIQQVELRELLEAQIRRGLRLFLVPVRSTLYQGSYLEKFQWARPPDKPLALLSCAEQEAAIVQICQKIASDTTSSADAPEIQKQTIEALQSVPKLELPSIYELQAPVGVGQFARCYLAKDRLVDRNVIIKVLNTELSRDSPAYDRYVRSASRLMHRNILGLLFSQNQKLPHFLVTPSLDGQTLKERLGPDRQPLSFSLAIGFAITMADALAYAHSRNCVHGRLRPSEIRFDTEDQPVLTGFRTVDGSGGASQLQADAAITLEDFLYASPEYRKSGVVHPKSDQYLLGMVCYEMLAGAPPVSIPTWGSILDPDTSHALAHPRPLKDVVAGCDAHISDIIMRMLAIAPEDRWDDLATVREKLRGARSGRLCVEVAKDSYRRCAQQNAFYETVYANLFNAIPEIRAMFTQHTLARQYEVLRDAIWLLLMYPATHEREEPTILSGIARTHRHLQAAQFDKFRDAILDAVRQYDSNDPTLRDAWDEAMKPGFDYLKSKLVANESSLTPADAA